MGLIQVAHILEWTNQMNIRTSRSNDRKGRGGRGASRGRDSQVVETIANLGSLTREQIQELYFPFQTGDHKARQRLAALIKQGKIKRGRCDVSPSFAYWLERPKQLDHKLLVNWVLIQAIKTGKLHVAIGEYITSYVKPDLLLVFKDEVLHPYFVEVQRVVSPNFDKVPKYTELFKNQSAWADKWWAQRPGNRKKFPNILVMTDGSQHFKNRILNLIKEQNECNLTFEVYTLDEFKKWKGI